MVVGLGLLLETADLGGLVVSLRGGVSFQCSNQSMNSAYERWVWSLPMLSTGKWNGCDMRFYTVCQALDIVLEVS